MDMTKRDVQYHIGLGQGDAGGYCILPGDPGRCERIAALLDDSRFVHSNREFTTWAGTLEGKKVSVVSTGIGGPSAAIAVEELHQIGVHTFLRIGTCGGIRLDVQSGDVVVATGGGMVLNPENRRFMRDHGTVFYLAAPAEALARRLARRDGETEQDIRDRGLDLLDQMGLSDRAGHYPHQLSGGQKQRVAIARALCMEPDVLCFDEPTSALDPELTGEVLAVMRGLAQEGMTMLVVTHEMNFARNVSSKVVFMEGGVVVEESRDPKAFFQNPSQERSKAFLRTILGETEQEEIQ